MDDLKTRSVYMKTCLYVFLNKREELSRFFWGKSNIFKCFHVPETFLRLLNYECYVHVCIFSLYISLFVLVISASIHHDVNYSDIQVLMMVTETETFNVDFTS